MSARLKAGPSKPARTDVLIGVFALVMVAALMVSIPAMARVVRGTEVLARNVSAPQAERANVATAQAVAALPAAADPDLCASTGTVTMPDGTVVEIWGFSLDGGDGCDASDEPDLPGPVIEATVGDMVTINLTNVDVPENVSIVIPGTELAPDTGGVPALPDPGATRSYTFTATDPGTYLYETGVDDQRGVLMGLYGALIVRPATAGQAYDTAASAYDQEEILVLSELDPNFNNDPGSFDLVDYAPTYWLINGEAYPDTDPIAVASGERLLLRFLNAGSLHHTMALLGASQRVIARDAYPVSNPYDLVSETIASGQTTDAITVPCGSDSSQVPLYNANLRLTNGGLSSSPHEPGGMQTVIELSAGSCPTAGNIAPTVDAGPNQTITPTSLPATIVLDGTVNDDFVTPVTATWTRDSGPGTATFANAGDVDTTVELTQAGTNVFRLTVDDGVNAPVSDTVTITLTAPVLLYFSTEGNVNVGGLGDPNDADIYAWHGGSSYSRIFDADLNGVLGPADVDALVVVDDNTIYLSFLSDTTLSGTLAVADEDVVLFDAGNWSVVFDGSDVGLTTNAEDVDAFEVLGAGAIVVSTDGNPDVGLPGNEQDEDLLRCIGAFGPTTSCTWSYYMDGSDVGLTAAGEDVDGAAVNGGAVSLTTQNGFSVTGASGNDEDVFVCASLTPGTTTSCPGGWVVFFDGSASEITDDLDAIDRP